MKRTPLNRTKGLRPMSAKKQSERRKSAKLRDAMKDRLNSRCERCGIIAELEEHHIAAGSHRRELANPRSLLYLCHNCHSEVQSQPVGEQFKLVVAAVIEAINGEIGRKVLP